MKERVLLVFLLLALMPLASAFTTTIHVETLPGHTVFISPMDASNDQIVLTESFIADYTGDVKYPFESDLGRFKVLVVVKKGEERIYREEFGPYNAGEAVNIKLLPDDYVNPAEGDQVVTMAAAVNNTENTSVVAPANATVENTTVTQTPVTANVVSEIADGSNFWSDNGKYILYGIGAFVLLFVVVFATAAVMRNNRKDRFVVKGMKPVKLSPSSFQRETPRETPDVMRMQKELQRVETEINALKKNDRMSQAEQRLAERRKVLEELRGKQLASRSSFTSRPASSESPYAAKRFTSSASRANSVNSGGSGKTGGLTSLTGDAMKSKEINDRVQAEDKKDSGNSEDKS